MDFGNADSWGAAIYFWIFPFVIGDAIFPPVPSEMVVITGGALSAEGRINGFLVVLLAAVSSWLGDLLVFQLFKRRLSHVLDRWKWGRQFHAAVHAAIAKAGRSSTYGAIIGIRFIPGGRLATTAAAGIANVSTRGFSLCAALGGLLWASLVRGAGLFHGLRHRAAVLGELPDRRRRRAGDRRRRGRDRDAAPGQPLPRGVRRGRPGRGTGLLDADF